jgi:hypothetical protein
MGEPTVYATVDFRTLNEERALTPPKRRGWWRLTIFLRLSVYLVGISACFVVLWWGARQVPWWWFAVLCTMGDLVFCGIQAAVRAAREQRASTSLDLGFGGMTHGRTREPANPRTAATTSSSTSSSDD